MEDKTIWQLLFVDDEEDVCKEVKEFFEGEGISNSGGYAHIETLTDFHKAMQILEERRFDLVILDIRGQEGENEAGINALHAIQQRRFVPVIFYTGWPHYVDQTLKSPLIQVVEKSDGVPGLRKVIEEIFATQLPQVNRALIQHMETVQRDYMWKFVANHWEELSNTPDHMGLAYLLARRLAMSLSGSSIHQLAQALGGPAGGSIAEGKIHPMRYYVMPPVEQMPMAGDLFQGQIGEQVGYWVLLTPTCDLVWNNADQVLLAWCTPLTDLKEFQTWQAGLPQPSVTAHKGLKTVLQNNRAKQSDRYFFLPGTLSLKNLVVDFQQLVSLPCERLNDLERLASLDSPFAEALLSRFVRYFGRLGTPDLDVDVIFSKLGFIGGQE